MFGRRLIKEISGTVFLDSNNDGIRDNSEQPLKDVGIKLFSVVGREIWGGKRNETEVLREKHIVTVKTNEHGGFRFRVHEGIYSVSLDVETLPLGKGVTDTSRLFGIGEAGIVNFAVRDVKSIHMQQSPVRINIGEHFMLNPLAKDKTGNILTARINYFTEGKGLDFRSNLCRTLPEVFQNTRTDIIIDGGSSKWRVPVDISIPEVCSADKVNLAHRFGLIDDHEKIRYLLQALYSRGKLPGAYYSRIPIKSGTRSVEEIKKYIDRTDADPEIAASAKRSLDSSIPKLDRTYRSPEGYFNIHYTLTGENAVAARTRDPRAVPEYIRQIGIAFDQVRAFTCSARGFREPVLDGGKSAYDIYVFDQKGKYGVTYSLEIHNDPNARTSVASSYICIDNTYSSEKGFDESRDDCMRVTAAHEFFHAIQYAYNVKADIWWKEASATWNEDEVYTGINDYVRYVGSYFSAPYKSLDESSYSGVIFVKFLSENYGGYDMIKRIWELQASDYDNSVSAIDRAIKDGFADKDLGTLFSQFSAYNVYPAQYYKEGASWKAAAAVQHVYSSYPVTAGFGQLDHLASNYHLFKTSSVDGDKSLRIIVEGTDGEKWGFKLQKRSKNDKQYSIDEIASNGSFNRAVITLKNFVETYDEACLISSNLEREHDGLPYSFAADLK